MHDRRMFLQVGAALAVPAVGAALMGRPRGVVEAACAACSDDPVAAEAMRQFKAAIRALGKTHRGEHARQAGAALRLLAAHSRARNLDAEFRQTVAREAQTYGRDNVLMRPFDYEQFAGTAREFGVSPAPELLRNPTLAERRQALDLLLTDGIAAQAERAARLFERIAVELDARGPMHLVQTKEEQIAFCRGLKDQVFQAEVLMIAACLFAGTIACAFFSGYYVGIRYYYEYQTECSMWLG